jgi:hypothetical protein
MGQGSNKPVVVPRHGAPSRGWRLGIPRRSTCALCWVLFVAAINTLLLVRSYSAEEFASLWNDSVGDVIALEVSSGALSAQFCPPSRQETIQIREWHLRHETLHPADLGLAQEGLYERMRKPLLILDPFRARPPNPRTPVKIQLPGFAIVSGYWFSVYISLWWTEGFGVLATMLISLRVRNRRSRDDFHRCLTCGYDLRASTERCPECGEVKPGHNET